MSTLILPKKISNEFKTLIAQAIYEVLNDPDFGLELSERVKQRLRRAKRSQARGIPLWEIKRKYR